MNRYRSPPPPKLLLNIWFPQLFLGVLGAALLRINLHSPSPPSLPIISHLKGEQSGAGSECPGTIPNGLSLAAQPLQRGQICPVLQQTSFILALFWPPLPFWVLVLEYLSNSL